MELDTIVCGDCLDVMAEMPDGCVDLVVTSPPYYNAMEYSQFKTYQIYLDFLRESIAGISRILRVGCPFVLNISPVIVPRKTRQDESERLPLPYDAYGLVTDMGFKLIDDIIWQKPDGASSRAIKFAHHRRPVAYKPFTVTEYILVFRHKKAPLIDTVIRSHTKQQINASLVTGEYERTNVWELPPAKRNGHPAPFPEALAHNLVRYYSFVADLVFDPFIGSGTTAITALKLGRRFYGCDINQDYVDLANERIEKTRLEMSQMELTL